MLCPSACQLRVTVQNFMGFQLFYYGVLLCIKYTV
jgi:hypothetical protein